MNERIKKILKYVIGPAVLDVGCIGGQLNAASWDSSEWLHGYLREKFEYVVGIDTNVDGIKALKEIGYDIRMGDAENIDLAEQFDTILAGELIEHLSNPGMFLETARRHLKPEGRLIITTPYSFAAINLLYAFLKFPKTCSNPEHTVWFCPSTLQELARRYGYKVLHFELVEDYYEGVDSLLYRIFKVFIKPLLPKRLRNNAMLFVLEAEEK
jgi:SAM-dependent methyltransferase